MIGIKALEKLSVFWRVQVREKPLGAGSSQEDLYSANIIKLWPKFCPRRV